MNRCDTESTGTENSPGKGILTSHVLRCTHNACVYVLHYVTAAAAAGRPL